MPQAIVVDSSAVLAVIYDEPGSDIVAGSLMDALISTVNLAETQAKLILDGAAPDHAWTALLSLGMEICPLEAEQARIAGDLVQKTRPYGLSWGDRACLALALSRKAKVLTADRAWKNLELGIEIEGIR